MEKGVNPPCERCGKKPWVYRDVSQPDNKWKVCEDCVRIARPLPVKEPAIVILEDGPDPDEERDRAMENQAIAEAEAEAKAKELESGP